MSRDEPTLTRSPALRTKGPGVSEAAPAGARMRPPVRRRRRWVGVAALLAVVAGMWVFGPWRDGMADLREGTTL